MEKKTLFAFLAMVVLGIGATVVMRAPEKGQRVGPPPRPIPVLKAADLGQIEITTDKQEKVVLEKTPGAASEKDGWREKTPTDWPADPSAIKSLIDGLEKIVFHDVVTEGAEKHAEMGVEEGKAPRLIVKSTKGELLADLWIGKSTAGFTMVRPAGKNAVWQATNLQPYMINRDGKGWRDHAIFDFPAGDADKVTIEAPGSKLLVEKVPPAKDKTESSWKIDEATGDAPKISDTLDSAQVTQVAQGMATLKASDFADGKKPEETGLDKPSLTITVNAKGKEYALQFGKVSGDDYYVKDAAKPTIYSVKKYSIERVAHRPIDYRDKTLVKAKEAAINSVDISVGTESTSLVHTGDKWTAKGGATLDEKKVKPAISSFENLAAASFATEKDPAKTGLAKPMGGVAIHLKDGSTVALKIGAATPDASEYYVQKVGSPDLLMVKKYTIDRFLKKPVDFTVGADAGKKPAPGRPGMMPPGMPGGMPHGMPGGMPPRMPHPQ